MKRYETKGDVVVLYFDQIDSARDTCVNVSLHPAFEVNEVKESNIKIYDYYQPEHTKSIAYTLPSGNRYTPVTLFLSFCHRKISLFSFRFSIY